MDTRNWQAHCFGRHLLALPPDAKMVDSYKLDGAPIDLLKDIKISQIQFLVDDKEREARAKNRGSAKAPVGSMFIGRQSMSAGGHLVYFWENSYASKSAVQEAYLVVRSPEGVFKSVRELFVDEQNQGKAWAEKVQQALVGREASVIPQQPGFCIKGGMLVGAKPVDEEAYRLWVTFDSLPRVGLTVESWQVGKPSTDTLFSRVPAGLSALMNLASGTSVLRKREVPLGQQTAQEMLLRVKAEGKRAYHFQLETVGVANSATETSLTFEMSTTNILDEHGHVGDAAFKNDDEAVAFWDAILQSFKVRPGAV